MQSTPAAISPSSVPGASVAGPRVATIFVRRSSMARASLARPRVANELGLTGPNHALPRQALRRDPTPARLHVSADPFRPPRAHGPRAGCLLTGGPASLSWIRRTLVGLEPRDPGTCGAPGSSANPPAPARRSACTAG